MGVPSEIRWITPKRSDDRKISSEMSGLPEEIGEVGYIEHALRPGLAVYAFGAEIRAPVTLRNRVLKSEPYLWLATSFSGHSDFRQDADINSAVTAGASYCAMLRDPVSDLTYTTAHHRSAGLTVTPDRLRKILQGQRLHRVLDDFLAGDFDPFVVSSHCAMSLRNIASQISSHPYQGAMASLFLEAKTYEMLAETFRVFFDDSQKDAMSRARRQAHAARDIIMADLENPPRIADLAEMVGLSQRRLNEAFRLVFDSSPLQCLVHWRLDMAYRLLATGELTVKQVAHRAGYAHVSNFSLAFGRRFGHPPTATLGEKRGIACVGSLANGNNVLTNGHNRL
jgi:AraC-like DNA-binding protein